MLEKRSASPEPRLASPNPNVMNGSTIEHDNHLAGLVRMSLPKPHIVSQPFTPLCIPTILHYKGIGGFYDRNLTEFC